jgi:hypothetical protein
MLLAGYQPTITRIVPDKRGVAPLYSINGTEARAVATVAVLHAEGEFQTVDKLIAIERIWLSKDPPGPDARPEPLYLPSLAKRIGASANRISKGLKHLSRQGLAKHQSRFDDTTKRKHIEFAPTIGDCTPIRLDPLPHVITDRELARCRDCGSSDLVRNTRILCQHCGAIQSEETEPVNETVENKRGAAPLYSPQAVEYTAPNEAINLIHEQTTYTPPSVGARCPMAFGEEDTTIVDQEGRVVKERASVRPYRNFAHAPIPPT